MSSFRIVSNKYKYMNASITTACESPKKKQKEEELPIYSLFTIANNNIRGVYMYVFARLTQEQSGALV